MQLPIAFHILATPLKHFSFTGDRGLISKYVSSRDLELERGENEKGEQDIFRIKGSVALI
jgi:hypothetical protein